MNLPFLNYVGTSRLIKNGYHFSKNMISMHLVLKNLKKYSVKYTILFIKFKAYSSFWYNLQLCERKKPRKNPTLNNILPLSFTTKEDFILDERLAF